MSPTSTGKCIVKRYSILTLTVILLQTQWEHGSLNLEDTKIVIINTTNQDKVEDVAWHYKDMFDQEAVGHYVTSPMEFI